MREITVVGPNGRRIPRGRILVEDGERIWECQVRERRHLYRALDAWTLSEQILQQLVARGVERIRLVVVDQNREVYEIQLSKFLERAKELDQSTWKQRTERQYALPRRLWEKREQGSAKQLALAL